MYIFYNLLFLPPYLLSLFFLKIRKLTLMQYYYLRKNLEKTKKNLNSKILDPLNISRIFL